MIVEQRPHLAFGQGGRRFVHDDEPRIAGQRPADRDQLLVGDGQRFDRRVEVHLDADALQRLRAASARRRAR